MDVGAVWSFIGDQGGMFYAGAIGLCCGHKFTVLVYKERSVIEDQRYKDLKEQVATLRQDLKDSDDRCEARIKRIEVSHERDIKLIRELSEKV